MNIFGVLAATLVSRGCFGSALLNKSALQCAAVQRAVLDRTSESMLILPVSPCLLGNFKGSLNRLRSSIDSSITMLSSVD